MKKVRLVFSVLIIFSIIINCADACPPGYISVCGGLEIAPDGRNTYFVCGNGGNLECCYQCPPQI